MKLDTRLGTVVEAHRRSARVAEDGGGDVLCAYSPEIDLREFSNFAVGDRVEFFPGDSSQEALITAVLPRRNKISRPGPSERFAREQILAANVDLFVAVSSAAHPAFNSRRLDRYLALAERFGIEAAICLNKSDLDPELPEAARYFHQIGYPVIACSALTGMGMENLRGQLVGRVAVLAGPSGVGKSSLVRALIPGAEAKVEEVRSRDGKGRHATISGRLYATPEGLRIIDTPGLRELGLWGVTPSGLAELWRDFRPFLGRCRFGDCMHRSTPGCAVLAAVDSGSIPRFRLESYYRIIDTLDTGEEWE